MDRYLGPMWSSQPVPKPEGGKLRRKLQKLGGQRPFSVDLSEIKSPSETKSQKRSSTFNIFSSIKSNPVHRPSLPPSVKSEDGKWLEDFRKSGYLYRDARRSRQSVVCKENERAASVVVPEFAHLNIKEERPTSSHVETELASTPARTGPHRHSTLRRYAKTPVLRIGQLETHPLLDTQGTSQEVPSIESIAESYRALLESRCSFMNEEQLVSPEKSDESFILQDSSALPSPLEPVSEMPEPPIPRGTPRSDEGTLVNSDEDSSYLRHFSASPSPKSPSWSCYETASAGLRSRSRLETPHETPDLKASLDLLTKELSAAVGVLPGQANADTSAQQVLVMIEAYEKLRNRVLESHGEDKSLATSFDTWLKALRSLHDELVGADGERSESNYGD